MSKLSVVSMVINNDGHSDGSDDYTDGYIDQSNINTDDEFLTTASSNQSESSPNSSANHYSVFPEPTCCTYCLASWRVWLRQLIICIYIILFVAVSIVLLLGMHSYNINQFTSANFLAGIAMAFTVPMSLWGISQHLINYTKPSLQMYIIR